MIVYATVNEDASDAWQAAVRQLNATELAKVCSDLVGVGCAVIDTDNHTRVNPFDVVVSRDGTVTRIAVTQ